MNINKKEIIKTGMIRRIKSIKIKDRDQGQMNINKIEIIKTGVIRRIITIKIIRFI